MFADLLHFRDLDFKTTARVDISEFISFILECDRVQHLRLVIRFNKTRESDLKLVESISRRDVLKITI